MALDYVDFASFVSRMLSNAVHSLSVRLGRTNLLSALPVGQVDTIFPHQVIGIKKCPFIQKGQQQ
jgi:hypothetical protein